MKPRFKGDTAMAKIAFASLKRNIVRPLSKSELQEIAGLAYQFFIDRGSQHGFDQEDWLKAEAIVKSRRS